MGFFILLRAWIRIYRKWLINFIVFCGIGINLLVQNGFTINKPGFSQSFSQDLSQSLSQGSTQGRRQDLFRYVEAKQNKAFRPDLHSNDFPLAATVLQSAGRDFLRSLLPLHHVKPGETLYSISRFYFVSLTALAGINRIEEPKRLQAGYVLLIPPVDFQNGPLQRYQIKTGETIGDVLARFNLEWGQFQRLNLFCDLKNMKAGALINLPNQPYDRKALPTVRFMARPVNGFLTSRFGFRWGRMHNGLDLAAPFGTPVKAVASGVVAFAGWESGYGRLIKINHGGFCTYYAHLAVIQVCYGARVNAGQQIGRVGSSGHAYGSHLHFEIERRGKKINPYSFLY